MRLSPISKVFSKSQLSFRALWFLQFRELLQSSLWRCPSQMSVFSKTSCAGPVFIDAEMLSGARVSTCRDDFFVCNHGYEHEEANHLGLTTEFTDMQVLMRKRKAAAWVQVQIFPISPGASFHTLLMNFVPIYKLIGSVSFPLSLFRLNVIFATLRMDSKMVQINRLVSPYYTASALLLGGK